MLKFVLTRIGQGIFVVFGVTLAIFLILRVIPGDPVRLIVSGSAPPAAVEKARHDLGLDRPLFVQFGSYLADALQGDLGNSLMRSPGGETQSGATFGTAAKKASVNQLIVERIPYTGMLTGTAMALAVLFALPLGFLAGARKGSIWDRAAVTVVVVFQSMPNFWLGMMLVMLFAVKLQWLPAVGWNGPVSLILPGITLGLGLTAVLVRTVRGGLIEVLGTDHIKAATTRGIRWRRVLFVYGFKSISVPLITVLGVQIGYLLGGALVVEYIFNYPGIGRLLIEAATQRDYPVIQGIVIVFAGIFVSINILVDIIYKWLDPSLA